MQACKCVASVDRETNGAASVCDTAGDGLTDPPCCIGGELEAFAPVEFFNGMHETEVALLDEVEEGKTRCLVLLGDGNNETQVRLHEGTLGNFALAKGLAQLAALGGGEGLCLFHFGGSFFASFDGLGEADFVVLREKGVLTDVGEVEAYEILFVAVNTILCHSAPHLDHIRTLNGRIKAGYRQGEPPPQPSQRTFQLLRPARQMSPKTR